MDNGVTESLTNVEGKKNNTCPQSDMRTKIQGCIWGVTDK